MKGEQHFVADAAAVGAVVAPVVAAAVGAAVVVVGVVIEVVDIAYSKEVANGHTLDDSFPFVWENSAHPALSVHCFH